MALEALSPESKKPCLDDFFNNQKPHVPDIFAGDYMGGNLW